MAKASWLTTSPNSGNGVGSISNQASPHTGREARSTVVTVTAVGAKPATYKVNQKAKPEFVDFTDAPQMSAPKNGGLVTVVGKSNSALLSYSLVGETYGVESPTEYSANGNPTVNGQAVEGDPGKLAEYDTSVELTFLKNETIEERTVMLKVEAKGGQAKQISIVQAAGDPFISVEPTEITLEADGSAVSVQVKSNTQWTVS